MWKNKKKIAGKKNCGTKRFIEFAQFIENNESEKERKLCVGKRKRNHK